MELPAQDPLLESKQHIVTRANVHPDHVTQLDGYLKQSVEAGRVALASSPTASTGYCDGQAGTVRSVPPLQLGTLRELYQRNKNQPAIQVKRQL